MKTTNPREAVYLAFVAWKKKQILLEDSLNKWREKNAIAERDARLFQEIAYGMMRRWLTLDLLSKQFSSSLRLKWNEKILFFMALYQNHFMQRIPPWAIVNETIELAKRYAPRVVRFFNALLRASLGKKISLPQPRRIEEFSRYYSYPSDFVKLILEEYGREKMQEILEISNSFFPLMVRSSHPLSFGKKIHEGIFFVYQVKDMPIEDLSKRKDLYIQNATPVLLMEGLQQGKCFTKILDLCASPGGKILLIRELCPKASLWANDISEEKMVLLKKNLQKYGVEASFSISPAESFESREKFDLILLDVPCSNSGVLHKRTEARWRLEQGKIEELHQKQRAILQRACQLLLPGGQIWYMTCSILKRENEDLIEEGKKIGLSVGKMVKILPDREGRDGGFGCSLIMS